jgi:hypothetical protein
MTIFEDEDDDEHEDDFSTSEFRFKRHPAQKLTGIAHKPWEEAHTLFRS